MVLLRFDYNLFRPKPEAEGGLQSLLSPFPFMDVITIGVPNFFLPAFTLILEQCVTVTHPFFSPSSVTHPVDSCRVRLPWNFPILYPNHVLTVPVLPVYDVHGFKGIVLKNVGLEKKLSEEMLGGFARDNAILKESAQFNKQALLIFLHRYTSRNINYRQFMNFSTALGR